MTGILLENIRSVFNVGSIFRTADAVGASFVLLCGYTPCPIDRMGRVNVKMHKTALGAEMSVPWKRFESTRKALNAYPDLMPVAVEQTPSAVPYTECAVEHPLFIFGNEVDGISRDIRAQAQRHICLPMRGSKESLNVSMCAAVVLYHHYSRAAVAP